jgi:c-di-GMP-binding flagellar brake protein YcgR
MVDVSGDLFQFQRRNSMRVEVPFFLKLEINLTEIDGKKAFVLAQAHDISAGGVRFYYTDYRGPAITSGMIVKGVLHSGPQKSINIEGTIRHIQDVKTDTGVQTHYGMEFSKSPNQRMMLLSLEVQRRAIAGSS